MEDPLWKIGSHADLNVFGGDRQVGGQAKPAQVRGGDGLVGRLPPGSPRYPLPAIDGDKIDWQALALPVRQACVLVLARYTSDEGRKIIAELDYLDARSGEFFPVIFPGYLEALPQGEALDANGGRWTLINFPPNRRFHYSGAEFASQLELLESHSSWKYRSGIQALVFDLIDIPEDGVSLREAFERNLVDLSQVIEIDVARLFDQKVIQNFQDAFERLYHALKDANVVYASKIPQASDRLFISVKNATTFLTLLENIAKLEFSEAAKAFGELAAFRVKDLRKKK